MSDRVAIYLPGKPAIFARVANPCAGRNWSACAADLSEIFSIPADEVCAHDLYWGGEHGDENSVDAVVCDGEILATFDRPISHGDLIAIQANPQNSHARLREPTRSPIQFAAE